MMMVMRAEQRRNRGAMVKPGQDCTVIDTTERLKPTMPMRVNHSVPVRPDAIVYDLPQAVSWINSSRPNEVVYYHYGSIAVDQFRSAILTEKRMFFGLISSFGLVWPRQKRAGENLTHYYAIRCNEPLAGMPRNLLSGTVLPSEYIIMRALSERQSSQSVARCIREHLDIDDVGAKEIRQELILRGWVTNDTKPALTELGYSVLD